MTLFTVIKSPLNNGIRCLHTLSSFFQRFLPHRECVRTNLRAFYHQAEKPNFKGEDFLQGACGCVAIELVLHHASPVGPNRSVLMRAGSCPRVTRLAAAVSTNGVGPQINVRGR